MPSYFVTTSYQATMTLSVKKFAPKKAVSFAKACKYEPPSQTTGCYYQSDAPLQPAGNQRKYRRRGSKAPSMLALSKEDIEFIGETIFIGGQSDQHEEQKGEQTLRARRLSIMTMLKQSMDRNCILEPSGTLRRMSLDQKTNLGFVALLSPM